MMNKTRSARVHLLRFLFLLPLLVVVLLAFRNATHRQQQPLRGAVTDTIPKAAKEPPGLKEVTTIDVTDASKATVRLKSGKIEHYDLKITKEREAFEQKYGKLPEPPAPPPPPTLAPPSRDDRELPENPEALAKPELDELPEKPEAPEQPELAEMPEKPETPEIAEAPKAPVPPLAPVQVDCHNKKGFCITIANNNGEQIVIVKDKNNKILEAITLNDWNRDKQYEDKYGEIPPQKVRLILKAKPVTKVSAKTVELIDLKPVARVNAKQVVLIDLQPVPAVKSKPVMLKDLKPVPAVKAKQVDLIDLKAVPATAPKPEP